MADEWISFKCIEVEQPIGTFYIGAVAAADVLTVAEADIRRIDKRDIEKIIGIQRELSKSRVTKLQQYVGNVDATFPTSVILAVESDNAEYNKSTRTMRIRRVPAAAKIIDGQHRIAGLEGFNKSFELNVTVFVDMDVADQAMTFATINLNQTKVSKSLVYDLYEFQHTRSPQKTCHTIARLLNREDKSPLFGRIKILGRAIGQSEYEFITQATFVTELMAYITKDAMNDRDLLMRRKKLEPAEPARAEQLILRDLFISGKDALIADIIWNYFEAVAQRWPDAWYSTETGCILNRTQGFVALMKFFGAVYRNAKSSGAQLTSKNVLVLLRKVKLNDSDFTTNKYLPGTGGYTAVLRDLRSHSGL